MQDIGYAPTQRTIRATNLSLMMTVITAMLLIAIAVTSAWSTSGLAGPPEPMTGHSTCIAEAVRGPCS
jgi:malonyl CoA-acyl carrier protein transacylase